MKRQVNTSAIRWILKLWLISLLTAFITSTVFAQSQINIGEVKRLAKWHTIEKYVQRHDDTRPRTYRQQLSLIWGRLTNLIGTPLQIPAKNETDILDYDVNYSHRASLYRETLTALIPSLVKDIEILSHWLSQAPEPETIDPDGSPNSRYIHTMISGGNMRPYSKAIAYNHSAFAIARDINYNFIPFERTSTDPLSISVMAFLRDGKSDESDYIKPYWGKIHLLEMVLNSGMPEKKWVVWLDDDITANDFQGEPVFDQLIKASGPDTCIITAQDVWGVSHGSRYSRLQNNTGIVMIQNTTDCKTLLSKWLDSHKDPIMGRGTQDITFHEQKALEEMSRSTVTALQVDDENYIFRYKWTTYDPAPLSDRFRYSENPRSKLITIMKNRSRDWNFNTFKRFNFTRYSIIGEVRGFDFEIDIPNRLAALPGDAFVHHTGMLPLQRLALIAHSLNEISDSYPLKPLSELSPQK